MKVKLLKRLRKDYRIICEEVYITTKNGERVTEKRYSSEYWGTADGYQGWHRCGSFHLDIQAPLNTVHFWIRRDLRDRINKEIIVWP